MFSDKVAIPYNFDKDVTPLDKKNPLIVHFLIFCDIVAKEFADGIYHYKSKIINKIILELNCDVVDYLDASYGILLIPNISEDTFKIVHTKIDDQNIHYYDKCRVKQNLELEKFIQTMKENMIKQTNTVKF